MSAWLAALLALGGCGVLPRADPPAATHLETGHALLDAGDPEAALGAYRRAAAAEGLAPDILAAMGTANLELGRLGQAERLLRQAIAGDAAAIPAWNNLGVVLIEQGRPAEAAEMFRRAFALDGGRSDAIRDNFRLALAKRGEPAYPDAETTSFALVRRGAGEYLLSRTR